VIAGGGVRAVLELAGIHDILSKSLGTQNPINLVKATVAGLQSLRTPREVAELRGLSINHVLGLEEAQGEAAPATAASAAAAEGSSNGAPAAEVEATVSEGHAGQVAQRRRPGPDRDALLARAAAHRPDGRGQGKPADQGMLHKVRHLVEVEA